MSHESLCREASHQADLDHYTDMNRKDQRTNATNDTNDDIPEQNAPAGSCDIHLERPTKSRYNVEHNSASSDYGTPTWALRHMGWMPMSTAVAGLLGGPLKSRPTPSTNKVVSLQQENALLETLNLDGDDFITECISEAEHGPATKTETRERKCEPSRSATDPVLCRSPDWAPRCPHCGQPNEYGYTMCDPVLPRICQDTSK